MGKINYGRVILGGLLAGLVITIFEFILNQLILGKDWATLMEAMNIQVMSIGAGISFVVLLFVVGIAIVWLYAAIRPRFGAGPKTAIYTGLIVWFFAWLSGPGVAFLMGLFPAKIALITAVWSLFQYPIAALIGAWPYKEK